MNKLISISCLFLFFVQTIIAQDTMNPAAQLVPTAAENALLWKIEGKELTQPSYLYGTIHMIAAEDFFLTDATKTAFDACEQVTFEIDMEDMMNMGAQLSLMMKAFMNGGLTLKDLLNEEDYQLVDAHFKQMGLPLFLLERVKPMFLSIFASGDMDMMSGMGDSDAEGKDAVKSYEMEFMEMAKKDSKNMDGLETAEYQMSMFDSIPYKAQATMLVESIKMEKSDDEGEFDQMVEMYKSQDLQAMQDMLSNDSEGIGEYSDILLANRNRNWIPIMGEQMKEKTTFFAVGAGHLGGKLGVVALLRQEGYQLTAIDPVMKP